MIKKSPIYYFLFLDLILLAKNLV